MKIARVVATAAIGIIAPMAAQADTLTLTVTADNAYALYLSTDNSVLGTLIPGADTYTGPAGQWSVATTYSIDLTGSVYYLHVVGSNYTTENGLWNTPGSLNGSCGDNCNPDGFLGQFSLAGTNYVFSNSGTSLVTNTTNWTAIEALDHTSWTTPTGTPQSYGQNGVGPWGTVGPISTSAYWIWSNPDNGDYADLSTEIFSTTGGNVGSPAPLPGALSLFATGMGALGAIQWRRKRRLAGKA